MPGELQTERLRLRRWTEADLAPFADLNADPVVMEHFPATLTREESDDFVRRIEDTFAQRELGLFAAEVRATGEFAGFIGLWPPAFEAHFTPAIEVGWRLAQRFWGAGYATEGALAVVTDGFARFDFDEIVSMTATTNLRSQRVMQKLGMTHDPADDFDHPSLPEGHRLQRHVLYRLTRAAHLG